MCLYYFLVKGPRKDLPSHHEANLGYHLQLTFQNYQVANEQVSALKEQNTELQKKYDHLEKQVTSLTSLFSNAHLMATKGENGLLPPGSNGMRCLTEGGSELSGDLALALPMAGSPSEAHLRAIETRLLSTER